MLTKRKKKKSLGYAEPDESVQENSINLIQRFWSKERKKKEPRKENPPKGKGSIYLPSVVGLTRDPPILLSLSLSHSSRLHQKNKAEKKSPPPRSWLKSNQKDTKNITNRFAWASTLLLEARSDPLTGLRFPPPSLSPLLASPVTVMALSCHCTYS